MVNEQIIDISGPLKGEIEVPGDKSMTHRAIMLASLAEGVSTIYKPLLGEDCRRTMDIFRLLGVEIKEDDEKLVVTSQDINLLTRHIKFCIQVILVRQHDYWQVC